MLIYLSSRDFRIIQSLVKVHVKINRQSSSCLAVGLGIALA
jgi:hypothetical protein